MVTFSPNKDILVPEDMVNEFPCLKELFNYPELEKEFQARERLATRYKKIFNTLGLLALIFVVIVLLITTWRFSLGLIGIHLAPGLIVVAVFLALSSFVLAIAAHVIWGGQKHWLENRFAAERLRQWKFQQLLDGAFLELAENDHSKFQQDLKSRWTKGKFDLLEVPGSMEDFLNAENFELFVKPSICTNHELAREVFDAYLYLRLDYQAKYFSAKKESLVILDTWTNGLAKLSLVIAAVLAFGDVALLLREGADHESTATVIMGASALSAALISAAIRVVRSAMAISEETERCTSKWLLLKLVLDRFKREIDPAARLQCMVEAERVAIEELREFVRTFRKSDYLL